MTDISYSKTMTVRRANTGTVTGGAGIAYRPISHIATIELVASASATTIKVARLPSSARLHHSSQLYFDDLATSGSPTLDLGLAPVNGNITADDDILNDGIVLSSASTGTRILKDFANAGKMLWEYLSLSEDPKGEIDIYATVRDAATNATGTITSEIAYTLDA